MQKGFQFDIGPLSWVKPEIDLAFVRVVAALQSLASVDSLDFSPQRLLALAQLHQANGALQLIGLDGAAHFGASLEALLDQTPAAAVADTARLVERSLGALSTFLEQILAGQPNHPLCLFGLYREIHAARKLPEPDPVDLYFPNLTPTRAGGERDAVARQRIDPVRRRRFIRRERARYAHGLLRWLKQREPQGMHEMSRALAAIARIERSAAVRAFWKAASALAGAVGEGVLADEPGLARLWLRLERQQARAQTGAPAVAERLAREVLYQVARTYPATAALREVQFLFGLAGSVPDRYDLAEEDAAYLPRLRALKEVVQLAKTAWTRYASGYTPVVAPFCEQAVLLRDRTASLGRWELSRVAEAMLAVADKFLEVPGPIDDGIALELATGLLLLEDALGVPGPLPASFGPQFQALIDRLRGWREGDAAALRAPAPVLMSVVRRAQDRMAIAQLVAEIQVNLKLVEKALDGFFRDHTRRGLLSGTDALLVQVAGAFRVLDELRAAEKVDESTARVRAFAEAGYLPLLEDFEQVAALLSAISIHADALQRGPADIEDALQPVQRFEPGFEEVSTATVESEMAELQRVTRRRLDAWLDAPADAERKEELRLTLEAIQHDAAIVANPVLERQAHEALSLLERSGALADRPALEAAVQPIAQFNPPLPAPSRETEALADSSPEVIDAELLATFLEEATGVLDRILTDLASLRAQPTLDTAFAGLRRAFHTLKGSGRMVGLLDAGETAYAIERLLDHFREAAWPATDALLAVLDEATTHFQRLITALQAGRPSEGGSLVRERADALLRVRPGSGVEDEASEERLRAIFLDEATQLLEQLDALAISLGIAGSIDDDGLRAVHTLAGIAGTARVGPMQGLASALEAAMAAASAPISMSVQAVLVNAIDALGRMLDVVRTGRMPELADALIGQLEPLGQRNVSLYDVSFDDAGGGADEGDDPLPGLSDLLEGLEALRSAAVPPPSLPVVPVPSLPPPRDDAPSLQPSPAALRVVPPPPTVRGVPTAPGDDAIDADLLPFLVDEAGELLPQLGAALRAWKQAPSDVEHGQVLRRVLHTLKGSSRTAGAFRLGDVLHRMETQVEAVTGQPEEVDAAIDTLLRHYDEAAQLFDRLIVAVPAAEGQALLVDTPAQESLDEITDEPADELVDEPVEESADEPVDEPVDEIANETVDESAEEPVDEIAAVIEPVIVPVPEAPSRALAATGAAGEELDVDRIAVLRVRAETIDRLVNSVGEVAISRSRIDGELRTLRAALADLGENVQRLRQQMREIEIQAETQMQSRTLQADDRQFDPLEFDRFTRFQELTRLMAESVNDVATVQSSIGRSLDETDSALAAQQRLSRDLQQDLLRVRMLPFATITERMHRVVRQAAREIGREADLEIANGQVELDRSILERLTAPLEHVLRNAVVHGVEDASRRRALGKRATGCIRIDLRAEGNQVEILVTDDGAGLAVERIRQRAIERGLLAADSAFDDEQAAAMVFRTGFSTADEVTPLAGRGLGMDIVRADIAAAGGRVELSFERDRGTRVTIDLPLTLMVTQTVLVEAAGARYVVPSGMVEQLRQVRGEELEACRRDGMALGLSGRAVPFFYLPHRLGNPAATPPTGSVANVLFLRAGAAGAAIQVDAVHGNQEIVVKNTGPLLSRIHGISGATVLGSGEIVLIVNPIVLAQRSFGALSAPVAVESDESAPGGPVVMVVDDSLTVRRASERLLAREGFRACSARDGLEALEMLQSVRPAVLLVDIEMPRMDGFDLVRNLHADPHLAGLPIIMITSRTAAKHQRLAMDLGVDVFLGKPYREDELVGHIRRLIDSTSLVPAQPALAPA